MKAFTHIGSFRGERKFSTWLIQITINESRMMLRKQHRHLYESVNEPRFNEEGDYWPKDFADWREIPSEALERKELRQALRKELNVPVLVGVSEDERDFIGVPQISALVSSLRQESGFPIFLNADHTYSLAKAEEAARAGFDLVVFDASRLPLEENVRKTKETVDAVKSINPSILVEGEIGYIGTGSAIHEDVPDLSKGLTTPAEARQYAQSTGIDILAPAGWKHARNVAEHGTRKNEEATGYRANRCDQGSSGPAYAAWRIWHRRRRFSESNRGWD